MKYKGTHHIQYIISNLAIPECQQIRLDSALTNFSQSNYGYWNDKNLYFVQTQSTKGKVVTRSFIVPIQHHPDYIRLLALHVERVRALEADDANLRALVVALFYLSESQRGI